MLKFKSIYSGSSGNSSLVESNNTKILIDSGGSFKRLSTALINNNIDISSIDGVILTHEHQDHVQSVGLLSSKYNIPVYANSKTWDNMPKVKDRISDTNKKIFKTSEKFEIGDLIIDSFLIPHDAAEPVGFNVLNQNDKLSLLTDCGHMTKEILDKLDGSSFALIESNYDSEMLKSGKYPYYLKSRILGKNGHLSNETTAEAISYLLKGSLKNVLLGHLSGENNFPELAYQTVLNEILNSNQNYNKLKIDVASRKDGFDSINVSELSKSNPQ